MKADVRERRRKKVEGKEMRDHRQWSVSLASKPASDSSFYLQHTNFVRSEHVSWKIVMAPKPSSEWNRKGEHEGGWKYLEGR
jgi:hypothetical protein